MWMSLIMFRSYERGLKMLAREHLKLSAIRQKRYYDVRVNEQPYKPGNLVWAMNKVRRKCPEMQMQWIGPLVVVKRLTHVTYLVKN